MARIVCISDLHLGEFEENDVYGKTPSTQVTKSISEDSLAILEEALEYNFKKEKMDLMIFCGDYIKGADSAEKKERAKKRFKEFLKRIEQLDIFRNENNKRNKIMIVPGNHDVNREKEDILEEFKDVTESYLTPFRGEFSPEGIVAPTYIFDDLKLIVDCESTVDNSAAQSEDVKKNIARVEKLKDNGNDVEEILMWLKSQVIKDIPTITTRGEFIHRNKAIDDDKENVGRKNYQKIVVTHHPLLSGVERAKTSKEYNYTVGGYEFLETAKEYGYNIFIHGHVHEASCVEIWDHISDNERGMIQIGVPEFGGTKGIVVVDSADDLADTRIKWMEIDERRRCFKEKKLILPRYKMNKQDYGVNSMEILVDYQIEELINEGNVIKRGNSSHIEAASYDCSLGYSYKRSEIPFPNWEEKELLTIESCNGEPAVIELQPHETVLIYTDEEFDIPANMVLHASPMSSWVRKGLNVGISYFVDPGFQGAFCFPVTNETEKVLKINSREPIMSVEILRQERMPQKLWKDRHEDKFKMRKERKC